VEAITYIHGLPIEDLAEINAEACTGSMGSAMRVALLDCRFLWPRKFLHMMPQQTAHFASDFAVVIVVGAR
jgi:hypothetical protein